MPFGGRGDLPGGDGGAPFIRLRQAAKTYRSLAGPVLALRGIDLEVTRGEFVAILGPSGAGKTTLLNIIGGLDRSSRGEVWVAGAALHRLGAEAAARWRGRTVGFVFQSFELLPSLTVLHNVMLPMDLAGKYGRRQRRERALFLLAALEIAGQEHKYPAALSGGQRQRVAIARAMANDPPLLLADEPTGNLDSATSASVLRVFEALAGEGRTVVLATHDRDIVPHATRVVELADGRIAHEGARDVALTMA